MAIAHGLEEIIRVYGNPATSGGELNENWKAENIVTYTLPEAWDMRIAWNTKQKVKSFPIHKKVKASLEAVMNKIWDHARIRVKDKYGYDLSTKKYDELTNKELALAGMNLFGGSFNFRKKRGGNSLSTHSWGIAIDFDPANNAMGDTTPKLPLWVVDIFEEHGWSWGGRWLGRNCDGMHFALCSGY